MKFWSIFFLILLMACGPNINTSQSASTNPKTPRGRNTLPDAQFNASHGMDLSPLDSIIFRKEFMARRFDFPVGKPDAKAYYNAQGFGKNAHLGDDWNGVGGGQTDFGDPVYTIANGYVSLAEDIGGGWGNVIKIIHQMPDGQQVEALYAHCDSIFAQANQWVKRGEKIATIGDANGAYLAHLHFEIRDSVGMEIGGGYGADDNGYLDPTIFIKGHRNLRK